MSDELHIGIDREPGAVVVRLGGEVDMANATELEAALATAVPTGADLLVIDVQDLEFIDSSGLRVLAITARALAQGEHPSTLRVRGAHGPVRRILEITGLESVLGVEP